MSFKESEQKLNHILLKIILGFSFIADSKDEINLFLKKHIAQAMEHLLVQYQKLKKIYLEFKQRQQEQSKKK